MLPPRVALLLRQKPPHSADIHAVYEQIYNEQAAFINEVWPLRLRLVEEES
jgi:hypothetical protein